MVALRPTQPQKKQPPAGKGHRPCIPSPALGPTLKRDPPNPHRRPGPDPGQGFLRPSAAPKEKPNPAPSTGGRISDQPKVLRKQRGALPSGLCLASLSPSPKPSSSPLRHAREGGNPEHHRPCQPLWFSGFAGTTMRGAFGDCCSYHRNRPCYWNPLIIVSHYIGRDRWRRVTNLSNVVRLSLLF